MKKPAGLPATVASLVLTAASLLAQNSQSNPGSGTFNGHQYTSAYFGFTYTPPDAWSGSTAQDNSAGPAFRLFSGAPPSTGETDLRRIVVQAEYLGHNTVVKTGKDFLDKAVPLLTGPASTFEALPGDTHYTFGGLPFDRIDLRSKQAPGRPVIYTSQVCTVLGDYALTHYGASALCRFGPALPGSRPSGRLHCQARQRGSSPFNFDRDGSC